MEHNYVNVTLYTGLYSVALSVQCSGVAGNFRQGVCQSVAFLSVRSRPAAICVGL